MLLERSKVVRGREKSMFDSIRRILRAVLLEKSREVRIGFSLVLKSCRLVNLSNGRVVNWLSKRFNSNRLMNASNPVKSVMSFRLKINKRETFSASLVRMLPFRPLVSYPSSIKNCSKLGSGIAVVCAIMFENISGKNSKRLANFVFIG